MPSEMAGVGVEAGKVLVTENGDESVGARALLRGSSISLALAGARFFHSH